MLKLLIALLITVEILLIPLMIFSLGTNILLPGVGLIISGNLIFLLLLVVEILLVLLTVILFRRLKNQSDKFI
jgi:uncharacterized membrane protein